MHHQTAERQNLELVQGLFEQVLGPMNSAAVDRFVSANYIQHSPMAAPGRDALKAFLDRIRAATPDAVHDVKRSFVDGDHVIVHYHVRPTPDAAGWAVIDIFRIEDGLIAEHWDVVQAVDPGSRVNPNPIF